VEVEVGVGAGHSSICVGVQSGWLWVSVCTYVHMCKCTRSMGSVVYCVEHLLTDLVVGSTLIEHLLTDLVGGSTLIQELTDLVGRSTLIKHLLTD